MNTVLEAPSWANASAREGTTASALRQLVNAAGPLSSGMAVALTMVQRAQIAEDKGLPAPMDATQRGHLVAMCAVAAQLLSEVALDAADDLLRLRD